MIDVVMTCYFPSDAPERQHYAKQALHSLCMGLVSPEPLRLIVADDSERDLDFVVEELMPMASQRWIAAPVHSHSWHNGIGASLNRALERVSNDNLWLYTTDDWVLTDTLDLTGPARLLRQGYDLVRLGPVHPDLQAVTRFQAGLGWWLDLRQEYGGFAFATRPFIATKQWVDRLGPFDEGLNSYEVERLYAERVARSTSKLAYWGGVDLAGPWEHIGLVEVGYRDLE